MAPATACMMGSQTAISAGWVVPVTSPPVRDGLVVVEDGRIVALGTRHAVEPLLQAAERQGRIVPRQTLPEDAALLPAFVNAHTHLELSWLKGCLQPGQTMAAWVRALMRARRERPADEAEASTHGIARALQAGTGVVGDVSNTLASCEPLARSGLRAVVFHELIGFDPRDPAADVDRAVQQARLASRPGVDVTLSAHAPYSVAPALFREIRRGVRDLGRAVTAVHVAESPEEQQLLRDGTGPWRELLVDAGVWTASWQPPGCSSVEYLARIGFLGPGVSLVHGVHCSARDLERLAEVGASLVTCPRSNAWLGVGTPPVARFFASGVNVAVGTDSLASNDDLDVLEEVRELRRLAPAVSARQLLACATINGARALGVDSDYGSIEPGKRASLVVIRDVHGDDVEEHIVGGTGRMPVEWVRV